VVTLSLLATLSYEVRDRDNPEHSGPLPQKKETSRGNPTKTPLHERWRPPREECVFSFPSLYTVHLCASPPSRSSFPLGRPCTATECLGLIQSLLLFFHRHNKLQTGGALAPPYGNPPRPMFRPGKGPGGLIPFPGSKMKHAPRRKRFPSPCGPRWQTSELTESFFDSSDLHLFTFFIGPRTSGPVRSPLLPPFPKGDMPVWPVAQVRNEGPTCSCAFFECDHTSMTPMPSFLY